MIHRIALLVLLLFSPAVADVIGAKVGGVVAPDGKTEIQVDLPGIQHLLNKGGSDGAGLCVFTSISHSARWQHVAVLEDFRDWMTHYPGGGWPQKVDQKIRQICAERHVPVPAYIQVEDRDVSILKKALASGRMAAVTYSRSPTGRYGGSRIAHMVSMVHADENFVAILDNNFPGTDAYEWVSWHEFSTIINPGGQYWAVILLDSGPPPVPMN